MTVLDDSTMGLRMRAACAVLALFVVSACGSAPKPLIAVPGTTFVLMLPVRWSGGDMPFGTVLGGSPARVDPVAIYILAVDRSDEDQQVVAIDERRRRMWHADRRNVRGVALRAGWYKRAVDDPRFQHQIADIDPAIRVHVSDQTGLCESGSERQDQEGRSEACHAF